MKKTVSVIIPNYNCSQWLPKVIESCLIQDFLHEIIIVDDYSEDNSWDVMQRLQNQNPELVKIYKNPLKGGNNARNYGFSKSSGEYIQWLDADDFLLPGKFENQLAFLDTNPDTDVVYSDWYMDIYETQRIKERKEFTYKQYDDFLYEILFDNWSANCSYLLNRKTALILHQIPAWNPETTIAQDREYITLAALTGALFSYTPGFFCIYNRWNENSVSSVVFKNRLELQLLLEQKFRRIILKNNYPSLKKRKYLSCLNAHVLNACYYYPDLTILNAFSFFNINWKIIHWKKRPFIPLIYIYEHLKYYFSKIFKSKKTTK